MKTGDAFKALHVLSEFNKLAREEKYRLAIGTRMTLANNLRVLSELRDTYEQFRNEYIKENGEPFVGEDGKQLFRIDESHPKFPEFRKQVEDALARPVPESVKIVKISSADLDGNEVPIEMLTDLMVVGLI